MCVFPGLTKNFVFDETLIKICRADVFWHARNLIGTHLSSPSKGIVCCSWAYKQQQYGEGDEEGFGES